jgi:hypothetical protein
MSPRSYHYSLRNNPEERSSHLLHGGSLKLCDTIDFTVIRDSRQELTEHTQTLSDYVFANSEARQ